MSDELKDVKEEPKKESKLEDLGKDELIEIVRSTRSEAKNYRLELKEIKSQLAELQTAKEKELTEKKLAEGKKDEVIAELTKQLETLKEKAERYDSYDKNKRARLKEELGEENWLNSFEVIPLEELELLASKFKATRELPDTDSSKQAKKQPGKLEALYKDLELAKKKNDIVAQIQITRLIDEEKKKK